MHTNRKESKSQKIEQRLTTVPEKDPKEWKLNCIAGFVLDFELVIFRGYSVFRGLSKWQKKKAIKNKRKGTMIKEYPPFIVTVKSPLML